MRQYTTGLCTAQHSAPFAAQATHARPSKSSRRLYAPLHWTPSPLPVDLYRVALQNPQAQLPHALQVCVSVEPDPSHADPILSWPVGQTYVAPPLPHMVQVWVSTEPDPAHAGPDLYWPEEQAYEVPPLSHMVQLWVSTGSSSVHAVPVM
mgnify:CR=1 FL=1